jgi:hypothetical protein
MSGIKERPIIFPGEMVRAILAGKKTQTRQVVKLRSLPDVFIYRQTDTPDVFTWVYTHPHGDFKCLFGIEGDLLWVKEKFRLVDFEYADNWHASVQYAADMARGPRLHNLNGDSGIKTGWRSGWHSPSHMTRAVSRITLEITNIRVERVKDIHMNEMRAEGVIPEGVNEGQWQQWQREFFIPAWNKPRAKRGYGWETNPRVWAVSFRRIGL